MEILDLSQPHQTEVNHCVQSYVLCANSCSSQSGPLEVF